MLPLYLLPIFTTLLSPSNAAPPKCPNPQLSCHNTTAVSSCCILSPGGQLLQTQFWDSNPSTGPTTSWTIHGLWPDNCDGSYVEHCDTSRAYKDVSGILQAAGESSLVDYMQTYWISNDEASERFWENEWSEHGTCVSTLSPDCYTDYQDKEEVVEYFNKVVSLFKQLDTYSILGNASITPSTSQTYQLSDIQAALSNAHNGKSVLVSCDKGELSQARYPFEVVGSFQTGEFQPADYIGQGTNCPDQVSYMPKSDGSSGRTQASIDDMDYRDEL